MYQLSTVTRITTYEEYKKKMADYASHIKMMIGKPGCPIPLHVMIVSGDKGVGKTKLATEILEKQTTRNFVCLNSSLSAVELYRTLWYNNDAIILIDDVNEILQDTKNGASLLKASTDSYPVRQLYWRKQNYNCISVSQFKLKNNSAIAAKMTEIAEYNPRLKNAHEIGKTFPDTFFFTGSMIILTNKPLEVIDRVTDGAVSNRGWHQEMLFSIDGAVDLLQNIKLDSYMGNAISKANLKKAKEFLTSEDAIQYYKDNGKLPTIRTLGKIATEINNGLVLDDDALANNTERPAY